MRFFLPMVTHFPRDAGASERDQIQTRQNAAKDRDGRFGNDESRFFRLHDVCQDFHGLGSGPTGGHDEWNSALFILRRRSRGRRLRSQERLEIDARQIQRSIPETLRFTQQGFG